MARRQQPSQADETLHEIEEGFDRLAAFVVRNRVALAIGVAAVLALALGTDLYRSYREGRAQQAAEALAQVRGEFVQAMGGQPGDLVVAEPANPAVGRSARETFVQRFEAVGREHNGTSAAALALLEAGNLHLQLGAPHLAQDAWQAALDAAGSQTVLEALVLRRIARAHEDADEWSEAAEAHERAARIEDFPAHWEALGDAARCRLEAGDAEAALALYAEIENGAATDRVPAPTVARLRELVAARELRSEG